MEPKVAAPKGVKNKKLWDKIEKGVMEYGKYKGAKLYKVVSDAYQKAGGEYTHKSDKKAQNIEIIDKIAAPKGVKDKALWDKIEKSVMEYDKYKGEHLYKVVSDAYQKAGGEYTHESEKQSENATQQIIRLGRKIESKLNIIANNEKKTIEEKMEKQERPTVPAEKSKDEAKFYEDLLKMVKKKTEKKENPKDANDNREDRTHIKKGDLVEFTRKHMMNYTMGEGEYGVATEDERPDGSVMVELADGSKYLARYIHAASWMGWMPEELEPIAMKYRDFEDFDY